MAVWSPRTYAAAEILNATIGNTEWRDGPNFLLNPPHAYAYRTSLVSVAHATWTRVDLVSELYDWSVAAMHSTSTFQSRVIAPETGLYQVTAGIRWEANVTGVRIIEVQKNSAGVYNIANRVAVRQQITTWSAPAFQGLSQDEPMNAGDYVELFGEQESGAALNGFGGNSPKETFLALRFVSKQ
jgi:hypothetical protein